MNQSTSEPVNQSKINPKIDDKWPNIGPKSVQNRSLRRSWGLLGRVLGRVLGNLGGLGGGLGGLGGHVGSKMGPRAQNPVRWTPLDADFIGKTQYSGQKNDRKKVMQGCAGHAGLRRPRGGGSLKQFHQGFQSHSTGHSNTPLRATRARWRIFI